MSEVLLLTLHIPHFGSEVDADDVADELVRVLNEQREPGTEPVMVNLLPGCPQWLDVRAQQMLLKAIEIVNLGRESMDRESEKQGLQYEVQGLQAYLSESLEQIAEAAGVPTTVEGQPLPDGRVVDDIVARIKAIVGERDPSRAETVTADPLVADEGDLIVIRGIPYRVSTLERITEEGTLSAVTLHIDAGAEAEVDCEVCMSENGMSVGTVAIDALDVNLTVVTCRSCLTALVQTMADQWNQAVAEQNVTVNAMKRMLGLDDTGRDPA